MQWHILSIARLSTAVIVAASLLVASVTARSHAEVASTPSLVISQLKITSSNGQFVTLYNATESPLDMSRYQLEYFNHYDLTKATSNRLIVLSGIVPPHGYFMVNDSALLICYQMSIMSTSLGFSSTAGLVAVVEVNQTQSGGVLGTKLHDYVGWSKASTNEAQVLPSNTNAFLRRLPLDTGYNPAVDAAGGGTWQSVQPSSGNPCQLVTLTTIPGIVPNGLIPLQPGAEPPATIITVNAENDGVVAAVMPPANIGLMAPQLTELLPNPNGSGNDASEEFIELYNPNDKAFDLTGFKFQSGTTSFRTYSFPSGTMLKPKSFQAFMSADTGISLSNTSGQVKLLDPFGNSIATTTTYSSAKDGQSWALANGKWYWTTRVTPSAPNIIQLPAVAKKSGTAKSSTKKAAAAKGAKTKKKSTVAATKQAFPIEEPRTPIHPKILATVGALALLYGAYEYRADIANRLVQLRRDIGHRFRHRS